MFCFIPVQTWFYARDRKKHGHNRPEARFLVSLVTVWLFPITLLWFAFTSDGKTSYWSPIVAGAILGFADPLLWLSMLNYITGMISMSSTHQRQSLIFSRFLPQCRSIGNRSIPHPILPHGSRSRPSRCPHVREHVHKMGSSDYRIHILRSLCPDLLCVLLWG